MKYHYKNLSLVDIEEYIPGIGWVKEMWKDIKSYEDLYQISNFGRVKSLPRPKNIRGGYALMTKKRILRPGMSKRTYLGVILYKDGEEASFNIHILVATHFIPNPKRKPEVNHKKGIKTDNRSYSLEWVTKKEQMQHAYDIGLKKNVSENHNFAKLTNNQVLKIFSSKLPVPRLAKLYSVGENCIYEIKNGKRWNAITGKTKPERIHLPKDLVIDIFKTKMTYSELAKKYKVPYYTVGMIKRGDTYRKYTQNL